MVCGLRLLLTRCKPAGFRLLCFSRPTLFDRCSAPSLPGRRTCVAAAVAVVVPPRLDHRSAPSLPGRRTFFTAAVAVVVPPRLDRRSAPSFLGRRTRVAAAVLPPSLLSQRVSCNHHTGRRAPHAECDASLWASATRILRK